MELEYIGKVGDEKEEFEKMTLLSFLNISELIVLCMNGSTPKKL